MNQVDYINEIHHPLSSLVVTKIVVRDKIFVSTQELADMCGLDNSLICENGDKIAENCTNKFISSPQSQYTNIRVYFEKENLRFQALTRQGRKDFLKNMSLLF